MRYLIMLIVSCIGILVMLSMVFTRGKFYADWFMFFFAMHLYAYISIMAIADKVEERERLMRKFRR